MLIDNKLYPIGEDTPNNLWEYIKFYTNPTNGRVGAFDIATGFFSIAGLNLLYKELSRENKYRIMLGELASDDSFMERVVDLLQGDSSIENAFQLSDYAKNAIAFLRLSTVEVRKVNNAFCHAKVYSFTDNKDDTHDYAIMGSSNLTEAGLGVKPSSNVELNNAETGRNNSMVKEIKEWFHRQWETVAKTQISVLIDKTHSKRYDVRDFLIEQIEKLFMAYTPNDIYYKILFEFFKEDIDAEESLEHRREMKFLKDTTIWETMFDYQRNGVISLVKLMNKYNGAILADAVGLGKTFTALGVIKYFQISGYTTLVLCPKKLGGNWSQYRSNSLSRFEEDKFDYIVRYHTDLQDNRLDKNDNITLSTIQKYQKLLIVIDESHNLRNHTSNRYKMLMEDILKHNMGKARDIKVLLLSATPINNHLIDVRNQFNLIACGNDEAFKDSFNIPSLYNAFKNANNKYTQWAAQQSRTINQLRTAISDNFFNLTGTLIVARTRHFIKDRLGRDMNFPRKKPTKYHSEGLSGIGHFNSIEDVYDAIKMLQMTAYQPTQYYYELPEPTKEISEDVKSLLAKKKSHRDITVSQLIGAKDEKNLFDNYDYKSCKMIPGIEPGYLDRLKEYVYEYRGDIDLLPYAITTFGVKESVRAARNSNDPLWQNNAYREMSLASMMVILFMKRLESSWSSCLSTVDAVLRQHKAWYDLAVAYRTDRANATVEADGIDCDETDDEDTLASNVAYVGKRTVNFADMVRLDDYISALEQDNKILEQFRDALQSFGFSISQKKTKDEKMEALIKEIQDKQKTGNKKVVVFTTFSDTAKYIYDCIKTSGKFKGYACVTGSATYVNGEQNANGEDVRHNDFMDVLERFAPYSKLFLEKSWDGMYEQYDIDKKNYSPLELYNIWKSHIEAYDNTVASKLQNEIDILIATDCLSEGQNLQDADMVINYDIHWNPVRLIQRYGRIDRIGSVNTEIQCVNFWPTASYENYLNLSKRISDRMLCMTIGQAEILDDATEEIKQRNQGNQIIAEQEQRALKAFNENSYDDLGEDHQDLTMTNISLSEFKEDVEAFLREQGDKFRKMPNGCFSGFRMTDREKLSRWVNVPNSLVAYVRNREDKKKYHLLCLPLDADNSATFKDLNTEEILSLLKDTHTLDTDNETLNALNADKLKALSRVLLNWFDKDKQHSTLNAVTGMLTGDAALDDTAEEETIEEHLDVSKYDLIAWDYVTADFKN